MSPTHHFRCGVVAVVLALLGACGSSAPATTAGGDPVATPDPSVTPPADASLCLSGEVLATHPLDIFPVGSYPLPRGGLARCAALARTPSAKSIDGNPADWIGAPSRIGGTTRLDAGESIHTDFLFDAYGADDGTNAQRLALLNPLAGIDARIGRFDALFQAGGDQLGVPAPIGADDKYGNTVDLADEADLYELRWAAQQSSVYLLARWTTLTDPAHARLLVLLDSAADDGAQRAVGLGSGLHTQRFDRAVLLSADGVEVLDLHSGETLASGAARAVVNAEGWANALEAELPTDWFGAETTVAVLTLRSNDEGLRPANVAYRNSEPVTIYSEQLQALALAAGTVDDFNVELKLQELRDGASETVFPASGYHERQFVSTENISREEGENGLNQPYGLFVPSAYAPTPALMPLDIWMHYRGGKTHSGAAWTPRLIDELGEAPGHIVITPRARGTSTWYVTQAHQDFFEVFADVHALFPNIDTQRRYLSGYSMGGYGTYLFGGLYPDLFAAGYSTSGAVTQGAWTGLGPDDASCDLPGGEIPGVGTAENPCFVQANEGDANAQLNYRLLDNLLHFPLVIHHGTNDELALTPGAVRMGLRMTELGYRHDMTLFAGYEHYTQAIVDEWADGAAYFHQFSTPAHPRRIVYKRVPALIRALNTVRADEVAFNFQPDGAWWVDELVVRDADDSDPSQFGMIDAQSYRHPAATTLPLPRSVEVRPDPAVSTPVLSIGAHSTPYVRSGIDWLETGEEPISNGFEATLTRVASVTLDVAGMSLDLTQAVNGSVTTDGDTLLTLRALDRSVQLSVDGVVIDAAIQSGRLSVALNAGEHALVISPK